MKKIILILMFSLVFCHKTNQNSNQDKIDKPDLLLLKLTWQEGEVSIKRNGTELTLKQGLELEKDDLIQIKKGSAELLYGINDSIKLGSNTDVSFNNVLEDKKTVTHITITNGLAFFYIKPNSESNTKIITPNAKADFRPSALIVHVYKNAKQAVPCDKNNCNTEFFNLNETVNLSLDENTNEMKLEKNSQIIIGKETELTQNMILPLKTQSMPSFKDLIAFHTNDTAIDPNLLQEWNALPAPKPEPKKESGKQPVAPTKQAKLPIKKTEPKKVETKKQSPQKKSAKQTNRDKLKLEANKKF